MLPDSASARLVVGLCNVALLILTWDWRFTHRVRVGLGNVGLPIDNVQKFKLRAGTASAVSHGQNCLGSKF